MSKKKVPESSPAPAAPAPQPVAVRRAVTAEPPLWLRLPGQPWRSNPRPPAKPFDLADCLTRFRRVNMHDLYSRGWDACGIAVALSPEEATFWLEAMSRVKFGDKLEDLVAQLKG